MQWRFKKLKKGRMNIVKNNKNTLWRACESLEFNVFKACNYIDASDRKRLDDFDKYQVSIFAAAQNSSGRVTGLLRLIFNTSSDMQMSYFPTLDHAKVIEKEEYRHPGYEKRKTAQEDGKTLLIYNNAYEKLMCLTAATCMDWATMAILPENRDAITSTALLSRTILLGWERGVRYALAAIDHPLYLKFRERGLPFQAIGPSVHYWGSITTPVIMDMHRIPKKSTEIVYSSHTTQRESLKVIYETAS